MRDLVESAPPVRPGWASALDRIPAATAQWIERRSALCLAVLSALYFVRVLAEAHRKSLWFDELFTFHITRMASWAERIEATAADAQPPLTYLFTDLSHALLGPTELATRLPEALGVWVLCLCLYVLVRPRMGAVYGLAAFVLPQRTLAFQYAYEARPYGLLLAFGGLALLGWIWSSEPATRRRGLLLLGLALAAAVGSHHYGLFQVVLPIAAGEGVRTLVRRRPDMGVLAAGVFGMIPFALTYPLARASSALLFEAVRQSTNFFARPSWWSIPEFYGALLGPAAAALTLALVLGLLWGRASGDSEPGGEAWTLPQRAALAAFATVPAVVTPFTMFTTGYFMNRYCLAAIIGVTLAFCTLAWRYWGRRGGVAILACLLASHAAGLPRALLDAATLDRSAWAFRAPEAAAGDDLPLVISDSVRYLRIAHYAEPPERDRLYFLTDRETAITMPDFIPELSLAKGAAWLPGKIVDYQSFVAENRKFWLLSGFNPASEWHAARLLDDGRRLELRGRAGAMDLYLVEKPD